MYFKDFPSFLYDFNYETDSNTVTYNDVYSNGVVKQAFNSSSEDNTLTLNTVENLDINDSIIFVGNVFGGVLNNTVYYIKSISVSDNKIKLCKVKRGETLKLVSTTGSMKVIASKFTATNAKNTSRTSVVKDITRNARIKKEVLSNISLYDEYDIVDGETPEIISEKFYGTPEYHWVIMIANEKYNHISDFPLQETYLQKHIATYYNPILYSDDWYWTTHDDGRVFIYLKVTTGSGVPFDADYLTAPVTIKLYEQSKTIVKTINYPTDEIGLDFATQYFYFPYDQPLDISQFGEGTSSEGVGNIKIFVETTGRENNPVKFVNTKGNVVNPGTFGAISVTGATLLREENDKKRRIKIIAPSLLETVLKNYEEVLG